MQDYLFIKWGCLRVPVAKTVWWVIFMN